MIVVVSPAAGAITLEEVDDFKNLAVAVDANDRARLAEILAGTGRVEDDHVWFAASALEALGPPDAAWRDSYRAMLAKVEPFGWYAADADEVRAHFELRP